jgi:hypothetical protein
MAPPYWQAHATVTINGNSINIAGSFSAEASASRAALTNEIVANGEPTVTYSTPFLNEANISGRCRG